MKWLAVTILSILLTAGSLGSLPYHNKSGGRRFIGYSDFSTFEKTADEKDGEFILTSPELDSGIPWNELVISWNCATGASLRVEAKGIYPDHETKWYIMGIWSADSSKAPRESVLKQMDEDGDVETDTLVMKRAGAKVRVRVVEGVGEAESGSGGEGEKGRSPLRFLGLSFLDTKAKLIVGKPNKKAWGVDLEAPERSQLAYADGKGWCSPTSTCMVLDHWAKKLNRQEMAKDVPEVAEGVSDPNWPGTGNWPFNTAYAGSFSGMRAYVTRLSDISVLESWIAAGVPVVCSVSYRLLHEAGKSDGHVVVCTGFTKEGDVIINDPWCHTDKGERPRCICPRANMIKAWAVSKNTVYLIYPENWKIPKDRFGHWSRN